LSKRMMKEMNEESAEQTRRSAENDSKKCARFKLDIASWLVLIKLIRVRSEFWSIQTCL